MKTTPAHEIPREKWLDYFNDLSKLYYGWGATVEVLAGQYGDQPEAAQPWARRRPPTAETDDVTARTAAG